MNGKVHFIAVILEMVVSILAHVIKLEAVGIAGIG